ncbi:MAG: NADP-dependent isocitrate dehydrogenase [Pseudomonadota bacterium]|nr:NADP-dependent isocitrate dehydrogenase [Pseudomonadota bacterium]
MPKISVKKPIVDINGDEMARILWGEIKSKLILPYIDIKLLEYDLGLTNRDKFDDKITEDAAIAIKENNVGVKCATITPDEKRISEYNLKRKYPSPNGTIRNILNGTIFREPIIVDKIPKIINHWDQPVIIARHAFGDIYRSKEILVKTKGKLVLKLETDNDKDQLDETVYDFKSPGVGLAYFNVFDSIYDFANSCFNFALKRNFPVFLSTKNTILQKYDEAFKSIFDEVFEKKFKVKFRKKRLSYQHRLIDDMVACLMKWSGGFLWACKNYDGDVMSDLVAQGFGSLGLMTSILQSPNGKVLETEAAHGTVTSHYRQHQKGIETSTNPIASIFAWTKALNHRAELDSNVKLKKFALNLEKICLNTLNEGYMTKDLALMCGPDQKWVTTNQFFKILEKKINK